MVLLRTLFNDRSTNIYKYYLLIKGKNKNKYGERKIIFKTKLTLK